MDLAEYISTFTDKRPLKIVEIGVGKFNQVSEYLNNLEDVEVIKIDILPCDETVIKDDITNPNLQIYEGVDLIYSIRPPYELQPYLIKLSEKLDSPLIIKPLFNEDLNTGSRKMKLKNYKKASFYVLWG